MEGMVTHQPLKSMGQMCDIQGWAPRTHEKRTLTSKVEHFNGLILKYGNPPDFYFHRISIIPCFPLGALK